jgi:hypothetical protein
LQGEEDIVENRIGDDYIYYTKSATHKGIVIGVSEVPSIPKLYTLKVNVIVGGK